MNLGRRVPILVLLAASTAAIGVVSSRATDAEPAPVFSSLAAPTTPFVPLMDRLTSSFFCAGVPAAADGSGGEVIVVNPTEAKLVGQVNAFGTNGKIAEIALDVAPRSSSSVDLGVLATEGYVTALVEVAGSGAIVEQRAVLPDGASVAPCSNSSSANWALASGTTLGGATYDLVLSNPFPDAAVVDLTFITATDTRTPNEFQNFVVPAESVRTVAIDEVARDESQLSLAVASRRGRLVAARVQRFGDGGASVALGAPAPARQWLFADGESGDGITQAVTVMNTGTEPAAVDFTFFPAQPTTEVLTPFATEVAPGRAVLVDVGALGLGFSGSYGLSVAGAGDASLVVERLTTSADAGRSLLLGSRFGSARWWIPSGVPAPTGAALVIFNASGLDGEVSVSALGPGGADALPGLETIALQHAGSVTIDLPEGAVGVPLLIESPTLSLVVERRYPAGSGRRSAGLGIPE